MLTRLRTTLFTLVVMSVALLGTAPAASAKTATLHAGGLTIKAPRGYRLAASTGGVYTLTGPRARARFAFGRSVLDATGTCRQLVQRLGGTARETKKTGAAFAATITKARVRSYVRCSRTKSGVVTMVYATRVGKGASAGTTKKQAAARLAAPAQVSLADVADLVRLVDARTGTGTPFRFDVAVPTKRFVSADGKGSATVPDLPGWAYAGSQGGIDGASADAFFQFGDVGGVTDGSVAQYAAAYAVSPTGFVGPDAVIANLYPQYAQKLSGATVTVNGVTLVPGTFGGLGPDSGMYLAGLTVNGRPFSAMFVVQSSNAAGLAPQLWYFYVTVIAVANDAPAGVGPALFNAWASWDPSGAVRERLAQTLQTIATTPVPSGGPIDPDVFQAAADDWDGYIRGEGPRR